MSVIAKRYADAFFELAQEDGKVQEYRSEIKDIKQCFDENDVKVFFESVNISKDDKKELVDKCFKDKISKNTLNFIKVIIDKGRMSFYEEIFDEFYHLCNKELNIKEGILETARPFDQKDINTLEKYLSKDGQKVELINKINKSLISGFKISFEDQIIDTSMKARITKLNKALVRKELS